MNSLTRAGVRIRGLRQGKDAARAGRRPKLPPEGGLLPAGTGVGYEAARFCLMPRAMLS